MAIDHWDILGLVVIVVFLAWNLNKAKKTGEILFAKSFIDKSMDKRSFCAAVVVNILMLIIVSIILITHVVHVLIELLI